MCARWSLCVHVYICADAPGRQKNTLAPLKLEYTPDCELPNMCVANWTHVQMDSLQNSTVKKITETNNF